MPDMDTLQAEIRQMREQMHDDSVAVSQRLASMEAMIQTEAIRCPYRETIARSANNREQIKENAKAIADHAEKFTDLKVEVAKTAVRLGGMMGAAGAIVTAVIMKMLGI